MAAPTDSAVEKQLEQLSLDAQASDELAGIADSIDTPAEDARLAALSQLGLSVVVGKKPGKQVKKSDAIKELNKTTRENAGYEAVLMSKSRKYDPRLPLSNSNPYYQEIDKPEEIKAYLEFLAQVAVVGYDIETTGFRPSRGETTLTHQFSTEPYTGVLIRHDNLTRYPDLFMAFKFVMECPNICKVIHNVKFEISFAMFDMHIDIVNYFDTMVAAYTIDENGRVGLKPLVHRYFDVDMIEFNEVTFGTKRYDPDGPYSLEYACADSDFALQLYYRFKPIIDAGGTEHELKLCPQARYTDEYYGIEMPLIRVLADMEHRGILANPGLIEQMTVVIQEKLESFKAKFSAQFGSHVNPDSSMQLADLLYNTLRIPCPGYTDKDQPSTAIPMLEKIRDAHPIISELIEYSHNQQVMTLYLTPFKQHINPMTGAIHTEINHCKTVTYRFSSANPNLQNLKRNQED